MSYHCSGHTTTKPPSNGQVPSQPIPSFATQRHRPSMAMKPPGSPASLWKDSLDPSHVMFSPASDFCFKEKSNTSSLSPNENWNRGCVWTKMMPISRCWHRSFAASSLIAVGSPMTRWSHSYWPVQKTEIFVELRQGQSNSAEDASNNGGKNMKKWVLQCPAAMLRSQVKSCWYGFVREQGLCVSQLKLRIGGCPIFRQAYTFRHVFPLPNSTRDFKLAPAAFVY